MLLSMTEAIHTRPFEFSPSEYTEAMTAFLRRRMFIFDVIAGVIVVVVARFLVHLDWMYVIPLFPLVLIIGFVRMPWRVRKLQRPVGRITFHIDEEGIVYSSSAIEPAILKWGELKSVRLIGGAYVIDGGFDDFFVHPAAFEGAEDERRFQEMARQRVGRVAGF